MTETTRIQSAQRALSILECIGHSPTGITAKEIAAQLNLALATVYHLLATLRTEGYVTRDRVYDTRWLLGDRIDLLHSLRAVQQAEPDTTPTN